MKDELGIGAILIVAIAVIVGLVLMSSLDPTMGTLTQTQVSTNQTVTTTAVGTYITLYGQEVVGTPVVSNASQRFTSGNYTIAGRTVNGQKVLQMYVANPELGNSSTVNMTYTYEPIGYVSDAGGRTVTQLILVFMALAIVTVVLYPVVKNQFGF